MIIILLAWDVDTFRLNLQLCFQKTWQSALLLLCREIHLSMYHSQNILIVRIQTSVMQVVQDCKHALYNLERAKLGSWCLFFFGVILLLVGKTPNHLASLTRPWCHYRPMVRVFDHEIFRMLKVNWRRFASSKQKFAMTAELWLREKRLFVPFHCLAPNDFVCNFN